MKNLLSKFFKTILLIIGLGFVVSFFTPATPVFAEPEGSIILPSPTTIDPSEGAISVPTDDSDAETGRVITDDPENPEDSENPDDSEASASSAEEVADRCKEQTGALSWIVCPSSGLVSNIVDQIYKAIEDLLSVDAVSFAEDSPIYLVWQYIRNITNIVFVIFLLVVIYSQLTGFGINNYGIKRVLPRLIIAVVLINLSFIICALLADISNIVGASLRELFTNIENQVIMNSGKSAALQDFSIPSVLSAIIGGGTIAGLTISAVGGASYLFFMFLIVLVAAILAVISGLITLAARQALVALLTMIAPLALLAYLLPNTEKWFNKWKDVLLRMLFFYPLFSFLYGASHLLGYTMIISAEKPITIILGVAVLILPLFFSWSLMKMSGTILNAVNSGIRRLTNPLQRGIGGWALSTADQRRQRHLANSYMPGAKLRRFLDAQRERRELDTQNSIDIRRGKAVTSAYRSLSSSRPASKSGLDQWSEKPNSYTVNAKRAATYRLRSSTALMQHNNTLSAYGRHFKDPASGRLAQASADAFLEASKQTFLTANEAQADQNYLFDSFLKAASVSESPNPYQYNRLIKGAAGSLGYLGETSIMGQIIAGNAAIENRRRTEARIIYTKFGYSKPDFRGMVFDCEHTDDDGYETDENGRRIVDSQRHLIKGEHHRQWNKYIGRHKTTGEEITKEEYDNLSDQERKNYNRVRYMNIHDDKNNLVQRVYEDDAGYMKELIHDDIAIGDPINRLYAQQIGIAKNPGEKDGILRKYHSTIKASLDDTRYREHACEMTAMLTSQANAGYIRTQGMYNIANLQSLILASKAGMFLQNDSFAIDEYRKMILAFDKDGEGSEENPTFSYFFPDQDIANYLDVNGRKLKGAKLVTDENGKQYWKTVPRNVVDAVSPEAALELRKNFLRHILFPNAVRKLASMGNRKLTPNILDNQKLPTQEALVNLIDTIIESAKTNLDTTKPMEERMDGQEIFVSKDTNILVNKIRQSLIERGLDPSDPSQLYNPNKNKKNSQKSDSSKNPVSLDKGQSPVNLDKDQGPVSLNKAPASSSNQSSGNPSGQSSSSSGSQSSGQSRDSILNYAQTLARDAASEGSRTSRNTYGAILEGLETIFDPYIDNLDTLCDAVLSYFEYVEALRPFYDSCVNIVYQYQNMEDPLMTQPEIQNLIQNFHNEVVALATSVPHD